jgi:hypothetical protein
VAAAASALAGLVSLLLGWLGVSDKRLPAEQIPYLASNAVFGLFCLGVAATLWLSADLRDEWRKLDQIHQDMGSRATGATTSAIIPLSSDRAENGHLFDRQYGTHTAAAGMDRASGAQSEVVRK